eukprot:TRINITY_DN7350_c0_g1_i1.p1 TRINITY_DN7350_c0_g1~~TRINITY_DN7350_c0_g1_i1.p1  ORF type:complete len:135 (+),score=33.04 TRINITY_DN7350_c0_g1_i1:38-406(+)
MSTTTATATAGVQTSTTTSTSSNEVEEIIKRLMSHKGVKGVVVSNREGVTLKSTLSDTLSNKYSLLFQSLVTTVQTTIRDIDPNDNLTLLRVRTLKQEIVLSIDGDYLLIVLQECAKTERAA